MGPLFSSYKPFLSKSISFCWSKCFWRWNMRNRRSQPSNELLNHFLNMKYCTFPPSPLINFWPKTRSTIQDNNEKLLFELKALGDFQNKTKSVSSNTFWYAKVFIFWKCIQYTIRWDKAKMLQKIPSDIINGTENALFFLSRTLTHHSFTFNLRFLYELRYKVRLSKTACGIWFPFC